jgi:autotransporter-associated beta strand protein
MKSKNPTPLLSLLPTGRNRFLPASELTRVLPLALGLSAAALTSPSAFADATLVGDPAVPTGNLLVNLATDGVYPKLTANMTIMPVDLKIGTAGATGRLDHSAGTAATGNNNWMFVGQGNGGNGTYNLADTSATGGTLTTFGPGTGSINVGGTSTTGGRLIVGDGGSSVGTVNMYTSGTLKTEIDDIGLLLGAGGTSNGTFKLDGGTVQINSLATNIGMLVATNGGDGTFSMTGATSVVNLTGGLWLGDNNTNSDGAVSISGGSFNVTATSAIGSNAAGQVFIGRGLGKGTFTVSGTAAVTIPGGNVGFSNTATAGTTGTLAVNGGTFTSTGELRVGSAQVTNSVVAAGAGTFNVTGGTANLGGLTLARSADAGDLVTGTSTISGGVLNCTGNLTVAYAGNNNLGQMTVSGGTVNVGATTESALVVNQWDTSRGQLTVSGGTINLNANSDLRFSAGNTGSVGLSSVTLSSGAITSWSGNQTGTATTGILDLNAAGGAAANNTFSLDGGTLTINEVRSSSNSGTALFNFNGGTLKAAGNNANFFSLSGGTHTAVVKDGGGVIDTNGFNVTIAQALLSDGTPGIETLSKNGAGTLTLTGANTFPNIDVNAGTLVLNSTTSSTNVVVSSGATLTGTGVTTGSLTFETGSTLTATAQASQFVTAETVTIASGTDVGFNGTPENGSPYVLFKYGNGGVSGVNNLTSSAYRADFDDDTINKEVTGTVTTGSLEWNTTNGTWAINTGGWSGTFASYFNGDTVAFNERPSPSTVTLNGVLLPAAVTVNNSSNPYTFTGSGSIGGVTSLTKDGAGALTIATANSYSGGTILNAGTLNLNNASALGTGTLSIVGGTIDNTSGADLVMTGNFPQSWEGNFTFTGTHSLDMGSGTVTVAGGDTDRTVTTSANTLTVGELKSATYGFIKQGAGTLVLTSTGTGNNASVTGALNVASGTLQINRPGVNDAGSGDFTATSITGTGTISNGAAAERWLFINTTGTGTFSGTLANGGTGGLGFAKQGTGSITLDGTLSYTGTTTVDAGTLTIPVANSGTGTGAAVNGGFLVLGNPAALGTPAIPATPNIVRVGGTATLDLAHDGGGPTYGFASNTAANATIIANRATTGAGITHTLTTVGNAGAGGGTLNFTSGANATSGTSRVSFTQFGLADNAVQTTVLNPTTAEVSLGAVTKVANATVQTLELGGTTGDNHITGLISNGTATGVALAKTNSSTWTISGANNTFTGGTKVGNNNGAGVLRVTASAALGTGAIAFDGSGGAAPGGPTSRLEL